MMIMRYLFCIIKTFHNYHSSFIDIEAPELSSIVIKLQGSFFYSNFFTNFAPSILKRSAIVIFMGFS